MVEAEEVSQVKPIMGTQNGYRDDASVIMTDTSNSEDGEDGECYIYFFFRVGKLLVENSDYICLVRAIAKAYSMVLIPFLRY